ncbi:MAG TPA: hypothetical protein VIU61_00120, partial [Kofleriaceae bacterium]
MLRFLIVAVVGCGSARPPRAPASPGTCGPAISVAPRLASPTGSVEAFAGQRVSRVDLAGVPASLHDAIAATLTVKPGAPLDRDAVRRDLAMLEQLQIADDIVLAATPDGNQVAIRYELAPRG